MTVEMAKYAQSLTSKPVKGMLTGPITCLQWSFVRSDQTRSKTAFQLALAIRDEVVDLERIAGLQVIQVDEPAIREGLPLHARDQEEYLKWAVQAFLIATNRVSDATQIHTHMCYSDFNEIFETIVGMDADVITVESAKSDLKLLKVFSSTGAAVVGGGYPNDIGPGVYDIHTKRIPSHAEIKSRVTEMLKYIDAERLWVNPDCGLKTRQWDEVEAALKVLVSVVAELRAP